MRTLAAALLTAAALTGPTSPAEPVPAAGAAPRTAPAAVGSFAGPVPGSDLALHVTADAAGDVVAYATDGGGVGVWFAGRRTGTRLDLTSGAYRLVADIGPGPVEAVLTVARRTHRAILPRTGRSGLWAARTDLGVVGWVGTGPPGAVRVDRLTAKWARLAPAVHALGLVARPAPPDSRP